uniref:Sororin-like middle region domain-containing protein n=1 Tax=Glossina austeni TaxID=7395 RepID=A0A1A9VVG2_GLOAU
MNENHTNSETQKRGCKRNVRRGRPIKMRSINNRKGKDAPKNEKQLKCFPGKGPQNLRKCFVRLKRVKVEIITENDQQSSIISKSVPEMRLRQSIMRREIHKVKPTSFAWSSKTGNRGHLKDLPNITELTSTRLEVMRSYTKVVENSISSEAQENIHKCNVTNAIILKKCFIRLKRINAEMIYKSNQQRAVTSNSIPETMLQQNNLEKNICKVKPSNGKGGNKGDENRKQIIKVTIAQKSKTATTSKGKEEEGFTKTVGNLKKCFVRLKRIQFDGDNNISTLLTHKQNGEVSFNNIRAIKSMITSTPLPAMSEEKRNNLRKLSLSFTYLSPKKKTSIQAAKDSTSCFEPLRNSTSLESGLATKRGKTYGCCELNTIVEDSAVERTSNENSEFEALRNSVSESKEAELSNLSETDRNETCGKSNNNNKNSNKTCNPDKTNKFFHRSVKASDNKATADRNKHSLKKTGKRKSSCHVYDFLTLSQTNDSPKPVDPAQDIIEKLIAEGKVQVATNWKGKGKMIMKRARPAKPIKKKKLDKAQKLKKANVNNNRPKSDDNIEQFIDNYECEPLSNQPTKDTQNQGKNQKAYCRSTARSSLKEGTFSRLAQSVLLKQTSYSPLQNEKNRQLLQAVKNIVSTPKASKISSANCALKEDLSPIAFPSDPSKFLSRPVRNSPWRVDESAHLPTIFNFSRNSDNLPSFSSDLVIPSTPRKNTSKHCYHNPSVNSSVQNSCVANVEPDDENSMPSFSSNDSNAENIPPPKSTKATKIINENIYNLTQVSNPRQTLSKRSPLKPIEILEIVNLPSWKTPPISDPKRNIESRLYSVCENEEVPSNISKDTSALSETVHKRANNEPIVESAGEAKISIFGFEEFLTQSESITANNLSEYWERDKGDEMDENNKSLHDKLKELRKWLPEDIRTEKSVIEKQQKESSNAKCIQIFDENPCFKDFRQRNLKDMLCSTMIQPSTSAQAMKQVRSGKQDLDIELEELFMDPESKIETYVQDHHRTYLRKNPRVRNRRRCVRFANDMSESESDDDIKKKSFNKKQTKRQPKKYKPNVELNKFVEEFNSMCEEVEQYDLVIEKEKEEDLLN